MGIIKFENKKIEGNLIEDVSDIINLTNLSPSILSFTINLKNGEFINYFREYDDGNESAILLELEKIHLQIKKELKR